MASLLAPPLPLPLQFTEEQFKVMYKRPTDLRLKDDVPVCCNVLVANVLDEGERVQRGGPALGRAAALVLRRFRVQVAA